MFTGIVLGTGKIKSIKSALYTIQAPEEITSELQTGQSVAVDGVCLTVVDFNQNTFQVEVMPETKRKSTFDQRKEGDLVNLELAMLASGRFDGHIVQGHVDATGEILNIQKDGNAYLMTISLPEKIKHYCIPQGSITINGISFTIARLEKESFSIGIIPHTWKITNLHKAKIGDRVNLEGDILGKYLVRFKELESDF